MNRRSILKSIAAACAVPAASAAGGAGQQPDDDACGGGVAIESAKEFDVTVVGSPTQATRTVLVLQTKDRLAPESYGYLEKVLREFVVENGLDVATIVIPAGFSLSTMVVPAAPADVAARRAALLQLEKLRKSEEILADINTAFVPKKSVGVSARHPQEVPHA